MFAGDYRRLSGLPLLQTQNAAAAAENGVQLQCSVKDRSRPSAGVNEHTRTPDFFIAPIRGEDASVVGAAVAILCAENADALLDLIGEMELAEGLPHPTHHGVWAKKDPSAASYYLIIDGAEMTNEQRIAAAQYAGVNCVYFADVIGRWGHFAVNTDNFPGGTAEVASCSAQAYANGVLTGAHSLSNFIHMNDSYVTPVPHEHLLCLDQTTLAADISDDDTCILLTEDTHYMRKSKLNVFRIGDELITFTEYRKENKQLTGCTRGAFGTVAASHTKGEPVRRLLDHPYGVVFPDMELQDEVAESLGTLIRDCGIRKFSFDGLEGTAFSGHGNYARGRFVKRVCDIVGNELMCDGSNITHYLWHAFSYCNWGEPFYDDAHRGGMQSYRTRHQAYFKRNLLPGMHGWYQVYLNAGRWEATPPETMEFILSRSAAHNAGSALVFPANVMTTHGMAEKYLDLIRIWGDFRLHADIPAQLRERMQDELSNWHLEETENGWKLTELIIRHGDLAYRDGIVRTEAGYIGKNTSMAEDGVMIEHSSLYVMDANMPGQDTPEKLHFRIRVGEPGCGCMQDLAMYDCLQFHFTAEGGDYLEYYGDTELYHYDANFRLKEVVAGEGCPVTLGNGSGVGGILWGSLCYKTDSNPHARYLLTEIRDRYTYSIYRKL